MEAMNRLLAVVVVLALLAVALWWLKRAGLASLRTRLGPAGVSPRLAAVERIRLSPQHALHLVRAGDRALVIALHAGGCTVVDRQPWAQMEQRPGLAPLAAKTTEVGR